MTIDLHMAKSIEELNKMAVDTFRNYRTTSIQLLYKVARNLYQEGQKHSHDDELSYIFIYRFLRLMDIVYSKETDKHFIQIQFDTQRKQATETLQILRETLHRRYAELELRTSSNDEKTLVVHVEAPKQTNIFGSVDCFITSKQLYQALNFFMEDILIMDARRASLFSESRLNRIYNLINIDECEIKEGMSAYKFEEKLSSEIKQVFAKRDSFGYIILMDSDSTKDSFPTSKLKILYDMLTVWDINKKYKRKPLVLNGGYMDFIDIYPTLSTNPKVSCAQRYADLDDLLNLDSVIYPPLLDKDETSKPHGAEHVIEQDPTVELDSVYKKLLYTAEKLYEIEDQIYQTEIELTKIFSKSKEHISEEDRREIAKLEFEKGGMEDKKGVMHEKKIELMTQIRAVIGNTNIDAANYLKRPQLANLEKATLEISRKRRKLSEELKKPEETKSEIQYAKVDEEKSVLDELANGELINDEILPDPQNTVIASPKPDGLSKRPVIPPKINRATKPFRIISTDLGLNGLVNIKNSCYMNSIIQCLRHVPTLKNFFVSGQFKKEITKTKPKLIMELGDLLQRMWVGTKRTIRPQEFYNKIVELHSIFGKGHHEDANEFYMLVYNFLSDDITSDLPINRCWAQQQSSFYRSLLYKKSYLTDQFYYQIRSDCTCPGCKQHIHKFDTENIILLAPPLYGKTTMQEMLDDYMTKCDISNLYCKDCEMNPEIVRKFTFQPRVLTIMFKRYYSDSEGIIRKINTPCGFPVDDLKVGNAFYKLWAICLHSGTMNSGHYTAACLNNIDNRWYEFNDEIVSAINIKKNPLESAAYMLFYQITDEKLVGFMQA